MLGCQNAGADVVLRNTGSAFVVTSTLTTPFSGTKSLFVADVDEDGDLDLFRGAISGAITLAINDGLGAFTLAPTRLPTSTAFSPVLIPGDFDRDGDVDVLIGEFFTPTALLVNRHRDLRPGQPVIGQTWNVEVWSEPGYATLHHTARLAIALAPHPQPVNVPGLGELWLDLGSGYVFFEGVVLAGLGRHTFSLPLPPLPTLIGLPLHLQALSEQARAPARFTAHFAVIVQ